MMTSMMLGGMRMPSVLAAAMVPVASSWLYLRSSMIGSAIRVIITTEAPMMPVLAAMIVPMTVTPSASPPGTRRSSTWRQCRRSWATPERSSMVPMKTKSGTATSTRFSAAPPQTRGRMLKNSMGANTSRAVPIRPNASDAPPSANATGKPVNNRHPSPMNM